MSNDYRAYIEYDYNSIYHHGVKGMKWGIRRYQNPDGTLTPEGRKRYGKLEAYYRKQGLNDTQVAKALEKSIQRRGTMKDIWRKRMPKTIHVPAKEFFNYNFRSMSLVGLIDDYRAYYQNPDGTLTPEGRKRYGKLEAYYRKQGLNDTQVAKALEKSIQRRGTIIAVGLLDSQKRLRETMMPGRI